MRTMCEHSIYCPRRNRAGAAFMASWFFDNRQWVPHFTSVINWTLRVGLARLRGIAPLLEGMPLGHSRTGWAEKRVTSDFLFFRLGRT